MFNFLCLLFLCIPRTDVIVTFLCERSNRILIGRSRLNGGRMLCDIDIGTLLTMAPCWRVCAQDGGPVAGRGTSDLTGGGRPHGWRASAQVGVCRITLIAL